MEQTIQQLKHEIEQADAPKEIAARSICLNSDIGNVLKQLLWI